ncbi:hypothetical protein LCGC14_2288180 [marine sediment metagenome]|uniref:Uncharacterized protein n=1 Tax=marine sediment metagenome TaxID=412755 RepID=A0A0F9CSJ8_9ZZZZ
MTDALEALAPRLEKIISLPYEAPMIIQGKLKKILDELEAALAARCSGAVCDAWVESRCKPMASDPNICHAHVYHPNQPDTRYGKFPEQPAGGE